MRTFTIALLAGVGALAAATGAKRLPIVLHHERIRNRRSLVQEVRLALRRRRR